MYPRLSAIKELNLVRATAGMMTFHHVLWHAEFNRKPQMDKWYHFTNSRFDIYFWGVQMSKESPCHSWGMEFHQSVNDYDVPTQRSNFDTRRNRQRRNVISATGDSHRLMALWENRTPVNRPFLRIIISPHDDSANKFPRAVTNCQRPITQDTQVQRALH